ncbi:ribosomal protein L16 [Cryptococcus sp. DSM 104549]
MLAGFSSLLRPSASAIASSSRGTLPLAHSLAPGNARQPSFVQQVRHRGQLVPKRTKFKKSAKGAPGGGSIKGTILQHGTFGLRSCGSVRLSAAQLASCQMAVRRKIKPVKGAELFLRVFPDIGVFVKGNEQRMGKGKGSFEYWSCRVSPGRMIMEIGGGGIREEIAKAALKLAQCRLPVQTEFVNLSSTPRLGHIASNDLTPPPAAQVGPAALAWMDAKDEGAARRLVMKREQMNVDEIAKGLAAVDVGEKDAAKGIDA